MIGRRRGRIALRAAADIRRGFGRSIGRGIGGADVRLLLILSVRQHMIIAVIAAFIALRAFIGGRLLRARGGIERRPADALQIDLDPCVRVFAGQYRFARGRAIAFDVSRGQAGNAAQHRHRGGEIAAIALLFLKQEIRDEILIGVGIAHVQFIAVIFGEVILNGIRLRGGIGIILRKLHRQRVHARIDAIRQGGIFRQRFRIRGIIRALRRCARANQRRRIRGLHRRDGIGIARFHAAR